MKKIPKIDSVEELAEFWDANDVTEFGGELEEVDEEIFERGDPIVVKIRLLPKQAEALQRIAESKGLKEADLLKEWVVERLHSS